MQAGEATLPLLRVLRVFVVCPTECRGSQGGGALRRLQRPQAADLQWRSCATDAALCAACSGCRPRTCSGAPAPRTRRSAPLAAAAGGRRRCAASPSRSYFAFRITRSMNFSASPRAGASMSPCVLCSSSRSLSITLFEGVTLCGVSRTTISDVFLTSISCRKT